MRCADAKVRKALKAAQVQISTPIGESEEAHLGDLSEDRSVVRPDRAAMGDVLRSETEALLRTLTAREEQSHQDAVRNGGGARA